MNRYRARLSIRHDEVAGFGPGAAFAGALAGTSGLAIVAIFAFWLWAADHAGTDIGPAGGLLGIAAWWGFLWLMLSTGVLAALWLGLRAWRAAYPVQRQRAADRERRAAVATATAIIEKHRLVAAPDEDAPA